MPSGLKSAMVGGAVALVEDPIAARHRDGVLHALAHPFRRALVRELAAGACDFQDLVARFPHEARTLHYHIRALREAGLVVCHRPRPRRGTYAVRLDVLRDLASMLPGYETTGSAPEGGHAA